MIKLLFLDVDGTIVENYHSTDLLPSVIPTLQTIRTRYIALVSNQGGVGLREYLMKDGPPTSKYPLQLPTEEDVKQRLFGIADKLHAAYTYSCHLFVCYTLQFQLENGEYTQPDSVKPDPWAWAWRKPNPGMLLYVLAGVNNTDKVLPAECLMVGDRPEDEQAATNAGIPFMWAKDFLNEPPTYERTEECYSSETVEIVKNMDGTYSLTVYGREAMKGSYQDCVNYAQFRDALVPPRE